jgi:hypothetical protein
MSEATLNDPRVRAAESRWYIYFDANPRYGPKGHVRAVIEEVCDEILNGDGGPKRHYRNVYLEAHDVATTPAKQAGGMDMGAYDGLDWDIENEMDDSDFQQLINNGTVIPITASR